MYKNFLIIILIPFFLYGCGYSPIYSQNIDKKLNLDLVNFKGDREINNAIKNNLQRYIGLSDKSKISIETDTKYTKSAKTKNLAGDTKSYNISSTVIFKVYYEEVEKIFSFTENTTINDLENKLDETTYETNIKRNFAVLFSDNLILQLIKLK
tara:strand:- start:2660 stop:3118 length:459 start_codon:yes stop_codon:yes gene_type:complete